MHMCSSVQCANELFAVILYSVQRYTVFSVTRVNMNRAKLATFLCVRLNTAVRLNSRQRETLKRSYAVRCSVSGVYLPYLDTAT